MLDLNARLTRLIRPASSANAPMTVGLVFACAFLTTFQGRLFGMSLPDLRGDFGLDVIQGAWLSAAMNAGQLLIMPITVWLSLIFGPARVIMVPSLTLALTTAMIPFARDYQLLLAMHLIVGLCLGTYLPLTMSMALRNLKPHHWLWAMAIYSLRLSFGTDVGVGASGVFVDHFDWRWIYWTTTALCPMLAFAAWKALPIGTVDRETFKSTDWGGMAMFCLSLSMLAAAFSLGETLGWFDSGVIVAGFVVGAVLLAACLAHIGLNPAAFVNFKPLGNHNVRTALLIACLYAILVTPTSVLIPSFLTTVAKMKPLQTGAATVLVFATYLAMTPVAVWLARRVDSRLLLILGVTIIAGLCVYCGSTMTSAWRLEDVTPLLILFAIGECLTLMGTFPVVVLNMNPAYGVAIGAYIPLVRIFVPSVVSGMSAFTLRVAADTHDVALRAGLEAGQPLVTQRVAGNLGTLVSDVARESSVLSFIDGFHLVFCVAMVVLLLAATLKRAPPNHLTPPKLV